MIRMVPADLCHAKTVGENMCWSDAEECMALTGLYPERAAVLSFALSSMVFALVDEDRCVAIGGTARDENAPSLGRPWLLSTPEVEHYPLGVVRLLKKQLDRSLLTYSLLYNQLMADNVSAVRLVQTVGFDVGPAMWSEPHEVMIRYFWRHSDVFPLNRLWADGCRDRRWNVADGRAAPFPEKGHAVPATNGGRKPSAG